MAFIVAGRLDLAELKKDLAMLNTTATQSMAAGWKELRRWVSVGLEGEMLDQTDEMGTVTTDSIRWRTAGSVLYLGF